MQRELIHYIRFDIDKKKYNFLKKLIRIDPTASLIFLKPFHLTLLSILFLFL